MIAITPIRAVWLATAVAGALLLLPSVATAGFSSQPAPIAGPLTGGNSGLRDVAVNSSGEALVLWTEGGTNDVAIRARRIRPDGTMGGTIEVTDGSTRAVDPHIDFAPNGRAIVGWVESPTFSDPSSVRARWIEPNDAMSEPVTVQVGNGTTTEPGELDLATTADDGAILAWHNFKSKPFRIVEAQYVTAGNAVSEPILPTSAAGSVHVQVAPNSSGGSVMTWRDSSVRTQAFSPTGVPGSLQTPGPGIVADPELASDRADHFQLVYKVGSMPSSLVYQAIAADGSFGTQQTLDPTTAEQLGGISVATNQSNRSVVAWNRRGTEQTVKTRFIAGDGSPEATTFASPAGPGASAAPSAGIGGLGGAATAWLQTPSSATGEIWGRVFPPGGEPEAPLLLSPAGGDAGTPLVSIGTDEVGIVVWSERLKTTGPEPSFQINARQILPPPACPDATGTIVQGRPTRIDLNCLGVQLQAPTIVAQPAHGRVSEIRAAPQSVVYTPQPGFAGEDSFLFKGTNRGGSSATQTARLKVGKDTIRPRIKRFSINTRRVLAGAKASARGKRAKASFGLRYSEEASATIAIERTRKCGGVAGVSRRCKKVRKVGTLRAKRFTLAAKVALPNRVGGKRLRPGRYRATAVATDPAGNRSQPKRLNFTVASG